MSMQTWRQKQASLENHALRQFYGLERTLTMLGARYQPYLMLVRNLRNEFRDKQQRMIEERRED